MDTHTKRGQIYLKFDIQEKWFEITVIRGNNVVGFVVAFHILRSAIEQMVTNGWFNVMRLH